MSRTTATVCKFIGTISLGLLTVRPSPPLPPSHSYSHLLPIPSSTCLASLPSAKIFSGRILHHNHNHPATHSIPPQCPTRLQHIPAPARSSPPAPNPSLHPLLHISTACIHPIPAARPTPISPMGNASHRTGLHERDLRQCSWEGEGQG